MSSILFIHKAGQSHHSSKLLPSVKPFLCKLQTVGTTTPHTTNNLMLTLICTSNWSRISTILQYVIQDDKRTNEAVINWSRCSAFHNGSVALNGRFSGHVTKVCGVTLKSDLVTCSDLSALCFCASLFVAWCSGLQEGFMMATSHCERGVRRPQPLVNLRDEAGLSFRSKVSV